MFPSLFFPRPSQPPVFDCLQDAKFQVIKTGAAILQAIKIGDGEALGNWLSMIMRLIMLSNETTQNKSVVKVSQIAFSQLLTLSSRGESMATCLFPVAHNVVI